MHCDAFAQWLAAFAWEVNTFIRQHDAWASFREMLDAWMDDMEGQGNSLGDWEERYARYVEKVRKTPELRDSRGFHTNPVNGETADGLKWFPLPVFGRDLWCWAPAEFRVRPETRPTYVLPIPLPADRALTAAERYAVLSAVHDLCCDGQEKVSVWPRPSRDTEPQDERRHCMYRGLLDRAAELKETDLFALKALLNEAERELGGKEEKGRLDRAGAASTMPLDAHGHGGLGGCALGEVIAGKGKAELLLNQAKIVESVAEALRDWHVQIGSKTLERITPADEQTTRQTLGLVENHGKLLRALLNERGCHPYIRPKLVGLLDLVTTRKDGEDMGGWWCRADEFGGTYMVGGECSVPDELDKWAKALRAKAAAPQAPAAALPTSTRKPSGRRGRKKLSAGESKRREGILERWERAREAGVMRKRFCSDEGITSRQLQNYQDWDRQRKNRQQ